MDFMAKKVYTLPSDRQLAKNTELVTRDREAEFHLCGVLLSGVSLEREAWLDNFYRIRVEDADESEIEVVIPGKELKNIKEHVGEYVHLKCKLLSKSDGVEAKAYVMVKEAFVSKERVPVNEVSLDGFALSAPAIRRGSCTFSVMVPHYSGIHNVLACFCDTKLTENKKIRYGTQIRAKGYLVREKNGYVIKVNGISATV